MKKNTSYTFQVFKGTHINAVLSAKDVDFLFNSPISREYFNWVENMEMSAEESYQSTLLRLYTNPMQVMLENVSHVIRILMYPPYMGHISILH